MNVDKSPGISREFKVEGIPATYLYRHGKPAFDFRGMESKVIGKMIAMLDLK